MPSTHPGEVTPAQLASVIQELLRELRGGDAPPPALDDDLERTLGVDSLARMELMLRLERAFGVQMPEAAMQAAQTPRDLLRALAAAPARAGASVRVAEHAGAMPGPAPPAPGAADLPREATTLLEVLQWHAERAGARRHVTLWREEGQAAEELSHAALLEQARVAAAALQHEGLATGEAVALMLPTGLDFLQCFMGILLAGGVPVPIYPPVRASQIEDHLRRQANILANAQATFLISDERALPAARILRAGAPGLRAVLDAARLRGPGRAPQPVLRGAQDTALIQYTSGSTGQPKGVVLTHANLLANIRAMGQALKVGPGDRFVSWLPLYHDMGLIGAWLGSLYHAMPLLLMPPQAFLGRPSRWLRAMSEQRATLTGAPNFAYEILATRVPDADLQGLDLRAWRAAVNGSEPVHAATLALFGERFGRVGFDRRAMMPVYGLAECGVGLAFPPLGRGPRVDVVDRRALQERGRAEPAGAGSPGAMDVVCCGLALPGHELRIVDEHGAEQPDRHEGRIEFRGPSTTAGYFRNPQATKALFDGDWLDSGDVGYIVDGEVYLTNRAKDLIIRGGHNIHPYDLEQAVGALPGIRRGCVAVFGAADPHSRSERVVVLAETRVAETAQRRALRERIAQCSIEVLGLPPDDIVLGPPHAVLKTSSGKIRRAACRSLYEQGGLGQAGHGIARQLAALWLDALRRRWREPGRGLAFVAFGAWAWLVLAAGALAGCAVALWPARAPRKRAERAIARAVVRASGLPAAIDDTAALPAGPWIAVANHASYLDWLLLAAALPAPACFVAKRELARLAPLRWLLGRVGVRFVERDDVHASVEDAKRLVQAAQAGECLVFFPEGTLTRAPGLRPFHMGAFIAAAQAGVAVVPVSLRGTRSVLRDGAWWPRRGAVAVQVHGLLRAQGSAWGDAVRLRDQARERVAQGCGEPVVDR
ncbi:AMP-binding protein [Ideonella sp.]|uniref:AMP-binding protein n=1 Tax=Ideonella sp. TaxID=1929293 RepID=UPI002B49DB35|nr:AMP-binding protein [Ideonella sp.]HJV68437.1 AMP-binding protein [Ideonella sp.]